MVRAIPSYTLWRFLYSLPAARGKPTRESRCCEEKKKRNPSETTPHPSSRFRGCYLTPPPFSPSVAGLLFISFI
ncbi:hypothetical protein QBC42DRAFT_106659 [Cladorrhinum samala]|uniref:Uncharacterized protein n=1 Tax=Cladorrhinum samala TaxID=585594 RepID=A0AAV9HKR7_9PEZI|nr:hypothetical protein QBC42DRAFT_106659 [Cladorrhinum samala]